MDMSLDLIKAVAAGEHITPYIHLPAQSGNDEMLKKFEALNLLKKNGLVQVEEAKPEAA